jgi:hypothetical protein
MNDDLERMWKEAGSGLILRYCFIICLEGLRKTTKIFSQIAGLWAEI